MVFGFVLGVSDFSVRLLIGLAAVGAVLGLPLFTVLVAALVHLSLGRRLVRSSPADGRAARRVLRSGELTGVPEVDRVARDLAALVLRQRLWPSVLLLCGLGALNLFNALNLYTSDSAWSGMSVFFLATGLLFVVMVAVSVPVDTRGRRRARAVADAYDARARGDGHRTPSERYRIGNGNSG